MDSKRGYGITFMDLDETLFRTYAKVGVIKDGQIVAELTNKEFNTYILKEGEKFDFEQFRDSKLFRETSIPIPRTMKMLKEMLARIKETGSSSRIIILTARKDFSNKEVFLQAFIDNGVDVSNKDLFYIDRMGNFEGTTAEKKRIAVLKYLSSGIYRRCRMIDDDLANLNAFFDIENNLPEEIARKVRETYKLTSRQKPINFYAIHIEDDGKLRSIEKRIKAKI